MLYYLLMILIGYLLGSILFAPVFGQLIQKKDIISGTKDLNPGTANAFMQGGLSKPGGLSSTEAAIAQVPYIHMNPIPGGESKNVKYFSKNGMSIAVHHPLLQLLGALKKLDKPEYVEKMRMAQLNNIPQNARVKICDWLETIVF